MALNAETLVQRTIEVGTLFNQTTDKLITRVCGYNITQVKICIYMSKKGNTILQKDIESLFNLSRPAISQITDQMVANGLLVRAGVETDKRLKRVTLTEFGKSVAKRATGELQSLYKEVGNALSAEELNQLSDILTKLEDVLENSSDKNTL